MPDATGVIAHLVYRLRVSAVSPLDRGRSARSRMPRRSTAGRRRAQSSARRSQQRRRPRSSTCCSCAERSSAIAPREPSLARGGGPLRASRRPCSVSSTRIRRRVGGVGAARDQAVGLEVGDRLRHRLRAHALGDREIADRARALAVQAPEHGALGEREAVLGAQPAHQVPEHDAQLAGETGRVERRQPRAADYISRSAGKLHQFSCII